MNSSRKFETLRNIAIERRKEQEKPIASPITFAIDPANLQLEDAQRLIEELHIYHVELEIQNDELRQSQNDLEAARDNFSNLYHNSPVGYVVMNRNSVVINANHTLCDMVQQRHGRLLNRPFSFLISSFDVLIFTRFMHDVFDSQKRTQCELRLVSQNGETRYVELTGVAELGEEDKLQARIIIQDIQERRQLQQRQLLLTMALEAGSEGVAICDMDQDGYPVVYASPSIEKFTDFTPEKCLGQAWQLLYAKAVETVTGFTEAIESKSRAEATLQFQMDNGGICWFDVTAYPLFDHHRHMTNFVHVFRDVTERVRSEETARRTQHLNSVSAIADGVARQYSELISTVITKISLAQMMKADLDTEQAALKQALQAAQQARALSRQLEAYAGKGDGEITALDVNQVIRDTVAILEVTMAGATTIKLDLTEQPIIVNARRGQVQQIILNLLLNASEAQENVGEVSVTTKQIEWLVDIAEIADHWIMADRLIPHVALISVKDNGIGIEAKPVDIIFDPFYSTKGDGRGMGLAATLGTVRATNGGIGITTSPTGSTVTVLLPIADAED